MQFNNWAMQELFLRTELTKALEVEGSSQNAWQRAYNQAARTLAGLGLCNAPLAESDTGFSFLWVTVLGTADALEVPPVNTHTKKS